MVYIGGYTGAWFGWVQYAGHPGFGGVIPAGYKRICIEMIGNGMYFNIDGTSLSGGYYTFKNPDIPHSWWSEAENIGNTTYRYGLLVTGYTN